jgi:hypothetical protein
MGGRSEAPARSDRRLEQGDIEAKFGKRAVIPAEGILHIDDEERRAAWRRIHSPVRFGHF